MPKLLLVDDEPNVLYSLRSGLESDEIQVVTAKTARQGLAALKKEAPDIAIVDVRLPDMSGLELFNQIKLHDPQVPVIVVTAFAATETAIEAMKRGAFEYLLKPVELHQLREVVDRALDLRRMRNVPALLEDQICTAEADFIIGRSALMQEVYKSIGRFAPQDVTVLILGESGTGKELVARALFQHSRRADRPFLAINCAAIPESLLESELFGHEKGAFTGADRQRIGKFEQANGGTLFLDEIGDMALSVQAKVLRVLQEQRFERLGGTHTMECDVRIIAATNQPLESLAAVGKFRQDLLYRLNGVTVNLPPLRARKEDIGQLTEYFLRQFNPKLEKSVRSISEDALQKLLEHDWPGNVRELQNVIRYAVIRATGDVITADCLPQLQSRSQMEPSAPAVDEFRRHLRDLIEKGTPDLYRRVIAEVDQILLPLVMEHVRGNQVHAAALLSISRTTLRAKLAALPPPSAVSA